MATINANTVALYIDTAGGALPGTAAGGPAQSTTALALIPVAYSTSASISVSNATYEVMSITAAETETTTRDFAVGATSTSMSVDGVVDWTIVGDTLDLDALFDAFLAKSEITAVWQSTSGGDVFGGKGFLTSFELSTGVNDFSTFSVSLELNGNPSRIA
jgi:TP901-1 family phage major tail protein